MAQKEKSSGVTLGGVLRLVVFLGIGFFFIYWFLLKLDSGQKAAIWASFTGANWWWVAATMVCSLLSHLMRALRWRLLFKPIGHVPTLNHTFGSVVVAYLGNLAFPRAGEVMRCATLRTSEYPLEWMPELGMPSTTSPSCTRCGPIILGRSATPTTKPARS